VMQMPVGVPASGPFVTIPKDMEWRYLGW
jgi:hypothetical protein